MSEEVFLELFSPFALLLGCQFVSIHAQKKSDGLVYSQLQDFLADQGVQSIDATGQPFDPNLHEAIAQEASAEVPEGTVIRQLRKGYKLKDRLLRPANVIVSKGKE